MYSFQGSYHLGRLPASSWLHLILMLLGIVILVKMGLDMGTRHLPQSWACLRCKRLQECWLIGPCGGHPIIPWIKILRQRLHSSYSVWRLLIWLTHAIANDDVSAEAL